MRIINVEWTGGYPTLCSGSWIITIDGVELNHCFEGEMGTDGCYSSWHFDDEGGETFEDYIDGLDYSEWIGCSVGVDVISLVEEQFGKFDELDRIVLFEKIQKEDWRHGSCGGCI